MKKRAIIIGSGIGGLASGIRLSRLGFEVEIFEASEKAGGKLNEIQTNKYRFDRGPSLFTLPGLLDELFLECGRNPTDYIRYERLDLICRYFYEDGIIINAWQDVYEFAKETEQKTGISSLRVLNYLKKSEVLYNLTAPVFLFRSFQKLDTFLSREFFRSLLHWYKLDIFTSMHSRNSSWFSHPHLVQLFDRYATYNGSNPYKAPATLNVIPHLEHNLGAYYPEGGMYSIVKALLQLARELGIKFHFQQPVKKIKIEHGKVTGIITETDFIEGQVVVSDADIVKTYQMIDNYSIPKRYLLAERSTSAVIFYWGMKSNFPELDLHNIFFSREYKSEFYSLFTAKTLPEDPTVYIYISSKKNKEDAPTYGENWFVMINAPENIGQDWQTFVIHARERILTKLSRLLKKDIRNEIEQEDIMDPIKIEQFTSSWKGSLYGNSSNSRMSAFMRHPNSIRQIRGLYFCGGSVHPGGGIPLCLASSQIAARQVSEDFRKYPPYFAKH